MPNPVRSQTVDPSSVPEPPDVVARVRNLNLGHAADLEEAASRLAAPRTKRTDIQQAWKDWIGKIDPWPVPQPDWEAGPYAFCEKIAVLLRQAKQHHLTRPRRPLKGFRLASEQFYPRHGWVLIHLCYEYMALRQVRPGEFNSRLGATVASLHRWVFGGPLENARDLLGRYDAHREKYVLACYRLKAISGRSPDELHAVAQRVIAGEAVLPWTSRPHSDWDYAERHFLERRYYFRSGRPDPGGQKEDGAAPPAQP